MTPPALKDAAIRHARAVVLALPVGLHIPPWAERLSGNEAALMEGLLRAYPRTLPPWYLESEVIPRWNRNRERAEKVVDVYVCKVRAVLGFEAIDTIRGRGFRCGKAFHNRWAGGPSLGGLSGWL